uniref:Uncharacterized protein n=1 Tax=Anguilla anguilla TaxID=7936 RepID=A0A0E9U680_ANGAN
MTINTNPQSKSTILFLKHYLIQYYGTLVCFILHLATHGRKETQK